MSLWSLLWIILVDMLKNQVSSGSSLFCSSSFESVKRFLDSIPQNKTSDRLETVFTLWFRNVYRINVLQKRVCGRVSVLVQRWFGLDVKSQQLRRYWWFIETLQEYDENPTGSSLSLQPRVQGQMLAVKETLLLTASESCWRFSVL